MHNWRYEDGHLQLWGEWPSIAVSQAWSMMPREVALIDLSNVVQADSALIALLVKIRLLQASLRLYRPSEDVLALLSLYGVIDWFAIEEGEGA